VVRASSLAPGADRTAPARTPVQGAAWAAPPWSET